MDVERVDMKADVLVVGGGSAGCMAAVKAKEYDPRLEVVIMEKGHIRRSGALAKGMDGLNIVAVPGISTPEEYVRAVTKSCEGILDQGLCYLMAKESFKILKRLEAWGVSFQRDEAGGYRVLQVHPEGRFLVPMEAPDLKVILSEKVEERGVRVLNRVMATSLLTYKGRVVGATGLNTRTGEFVVCHAKATILATGPAGRFGLPSSGYLYGTYEFPGNAGDGYSMAYRAGVELTGFEYTMYNILIKDFDGPLHYITIPRGAKVRNALLEEIDVRNANLGALRREIQEGRGPPLYIDMRHLPEEVIREIEGILFTTERPTQEKFFSGRGINFRKALIELYPTELQLCGGHGITGLIIDEDAKTSLAGLYAAGDVSSVPMQHLTGALVFGSIAGEKAAQYASKRDWVKPSEDQIQGERARIYGSMEASGGIDPGRFEYKVRRKVEDYLRSPKTVKKLETALVWIERFRGEIQGLRAEDYHELGRILECYSILDCAEMAARASLYREESRWGPIHYRLDFPERRDDEWLKHIIIRRAPATGMMELYTRPVELRWNI